jgi:hypothetical protein
MNAASARPRPVDIATPAHFHTGRNAPGYLPDEPADVFDAWVDAQQALAESITTHADALATWADDHDCDDIPCPTFGDTCPWQRAGRLLTERDDLLAATPEQPWWGTAEGIRYWLDVCRNPLCAPDDDPTPD